MRFKEIISVNSFVCRSPRYLCDRSESTFGCNFAETLEDKDRSPHLNTKKNSPLAIIAAGGVYLQHGRTNDNGKSVP
jgi:hypothetical protein